MDENGDEQPVNNWSDEPMVVTPEIDMLINNEGGEHQGAMNMKYEIEYGGLSSMSNDMVVFRLADIMMMKAECLMRLNGNTATQEAVDLVNEVRARSFAANDPDAIQQPSPWTNCSMKEAVSSLMKCIAAKI
jgi:hypothetical protein